MDTRLFYNPAKDMRYNFPMLTLYGFTIDSPDIHPLTYSMPYHNPLTQYVNDTNTVAGPDDSGTYSVIYEVVDLPIEVAVPNVQKDMKAKVTDKRWQVETGGIALPDGTKIATTIDDQNRISSALQGMSDAGIAEVDFKASSGWVKLTKEQLTAIAGLIANHVQACFSRERLLHEAIDTAKTLEELHAIEIHSGWPGQTPPREEQPISNDPEVVANNS